jgi:hypothetical protein
MILSLASTAPAATITLYYTAEIDTITHSNGGYGDTAGFSVGGNAFGTITFNDNATDSNPDANRVDLKKGNSPNSLVLDVTAHSGISNLLFDNGDATSTVINIIDNVYNWTWGVYKDVLGFYSVNGRENFQLTLNSKNMLPSDPRPTMLTGVDYALSTLDLNPSEGPLSKNELEIDLYDPDYSSTLRRSTITGYITYLSTSPQVVPIPSAVWLLGSGLIGLIAIRRR